MLSKVINMQTFNLVPIRALIMQTLSWSLKLFITSNNVDLESKTSLNA
jgi:hypothetical protein